jgi:hypothetical protein
MRLETQRFIEHANAVEEAIRFAISAAPLQYLLAKTAAPVLITLAP